MNDKTIFEMVKEAFIKLEFDVVKDSYKSGIYCITMNSDLPFETNTDIVNYLNRKASKKLKGNFCVRETQNGSYILYSISSIFGQHALEDLEVLNELL